MTVRSDSRRRAGRFVVGLRRQVRPGQRRRRRSADRRRRRGHGRRRGMTRRTAAREPAAPGEQAASPNRRRADGGRRCGNRRHRGNGRHRRDRRRALAAPAVRGPAAPGGTGGIAIDGEHRRHRRCGNRRHRGIDGDRRRRRVRSSPGVPQGSPRLLQDRRTATPRLATREASTRPVRVRRARGLHPGAQRRRLQRRDGGRPGLQGGRLALLFVRAAHNPNTAIASEHDHLEGRRGLGRGEGRGFLRGNLAAVNVSCASQDRGRHVHELCVPCPPHGIRCLRVRRTGLRRGQLSMSS